MAGSDVIERTYYRVRTEEVERKCEFNKVDLGLSSFKAPLRLSESTVGT
jgi:hypothetical protein